MQQIARDQRRRRKIMTANKELIAQMEQERDRLMEDLEQNGSE